MEQPRDDQLFPGSDKTFGEVRNEVSALRAQQKLEQEDLRRRQVMDIDLPAGNCLCEGEIVLRSRTGFTQTGEPRYGGPLEGYSHETLTAICKACELVYNAKGERFKPMRDEIEKMRS